MSAIIYYEEFSQDGSRIRNGVIPVPLASVTIDPVSAAEHTITAGTKTCRITAVGANAVNWDFVAAASLAGDASKRVLGAGKDGLFEVPAGATKVSFVTI